MKIESAIPVTSDFELPIFDQPMAEHWPSKMSWSDAVRNFKPFRDHYMRNHDSAEQRFKDKNPEPFRLD